MITAMRVKQRGITFGGMIMLAIALVLVGITAIRVIPSYMEDGKIKKAFHDIARDPNLQNASPEQIRASFSNRASVDGINAIKSEDIEISSENGVLSLSASYSMKVPLGGNVSLLLEFKPSSAK